MKRRAFTFVELSMGMAVLATIIGAVAALLGAVGDGWFATDKNNAVQIASFQTTTYLYRLLRSATFVGVATADDQQQTALGTLSPSIGRGAALMFWTRNTSENKMRCGELTVIEHDPAHKTLIVYQVAPNSAIAPVQYQLADISDSTDVTAFKSLSGVTGHVIANNVTAARFCVRNTNSLTTRQSVEYVLIFDNNGQPHTEYGTVCLRTSTVPKAW